MECIRYRILSDCGEPEEEKEEYKQKGEEMEDDKKRKEIMKKQKTISVRSRRC